MSYHHFHGSFYSISILFYVSPECMKGCAVSCLGAWGQSKLYVVAVACQEREGLLTGQPTPQSRKGIITANTTPPWETSLAEHVVRCDTPPPQLPSVTETGFEELLRTKALEWKAGMGEARLPGNLVTGGVISSAKNGLL